MFSLGKKKTIEYLIVTLVVFAVGLPVYYSTAIALFISVCYLIYFLFERKTNITSIKVLLFFLFLLFPAFISGDVYRVYWAFFHALSISAVFCYMQFYAINLSRVLYYFILVTYCLLFIYFLDGKLGYQHNIDGLIGSSNRISGVLLIILTCYSYFKFLESGKYSLVFPLLLLLLSIQLSGRAGIIFSAFILAVNLVFLIFSKKKGLDVFLALILVILAPFLLFLGSDHLFNETRLSYGIQDSGRLNLISDYVENIDLVSFLFGGHYPNTDIYHIVSFNPHNSYIRFHYTFGIFLPFFMVLLFLYFFLKDWLGCRRRGKALFFYKYSLLLILILRASLDTLFFPSFLDLFFFALLFSRTVPTQRLQARSAST